MSSLAATLGSVAKDGDDLVRVRFAKDDIRVFENYAVACSVLQQPSKFTTVLSARDGAAKLLRKYRPGTEFQLLIGPVPQFTGRIDGPRANGPSGSTSVTFGGRDPIAELLGNDVDAEQSFTNVTFADLVKRAMAEAGLGARKLHLDNKRNREITAGTKVSTIKEPFVSTEVVQTGSGPTVKHVVRAEVGESWLDFIRRHIAKAGLFLWADANGDLILSTPNPHQRPTFGWRRERGTTTNRVNVIDASLVNDTTNRYSEVIVYCRGGGRASGRKHMHGIGVDQEMVNLGIQRRHVYRDANVYTPKQAEAYAKRKIAEQNRASWSLTYTFSGHASRTINDGGRAVIRPDLIAHVQDDEFGINENLYIESCEYRSPPQTTLVTMMRLKDLVFGAD